MNLNNLGIARRLAIVGTLTMLMFVLLALGPNMHLSVLEQRANNLPQSAAALEEIAQAAMTVTAIVILFTVLLAISVTAAVAYLVHSIKQPLAAVIALTETITQGDLSIFIDTTRKDDFGVLMRSLASMNVALGRVVYQIRQSTKDVALDSAEIAQGNNDLAQRTERSSADLQSTASSMQHLTSTILDNGENALQASRLATEAHRVSKKGGVIVQQVVSSMNEINTHSQKISAIVGVIDGIAFQTNLLALNAAVESARAGEQGRGFAVVASEVRTLAKRSAEAAHAIKALIESSVNTVESGANLVRDVGSTMEEIVRSVGLASEVIQEITSASSEQSAGIRGVNQAIGHLDQMTQQNAALVEQMAAAASSLKAQAQEMTQAVASFQIVEPENMAPADIPYGHFTIGVEAQNYLPVSSGEGAIYSGFARELLDAFAQHSGYTFTYKPLPITHLFEEFLVHQRLDLKFPDNAYWSSDLKRKVQVLYSQGLLSVAEGLLVPPNKTGRSPDVLRKIAITRGFTPFPYLDRIHSQQIKVSELNTAEAGLKLAESGRVDGVYMGKIVANYLLNDVHKTPGALVFDESLPNSCNDFSMSTIHHPEVIAKLDAFLRNERVLVATLKKKHKIVE